jgi:hypothetical protein
VTNVGAASALAVPGALEPAGPGVARNLGRACRFCRCPFAAQVGGGGATIRRQPVPPGRQVRPPDQRNPLPAGIAVSATGSRAGVVAFSLGVATGLAWMTLLALHLWTGRRAPA